MEQRFNERRGKIRARNVINFLFLTMADIINKVANSVLIVFDLEDYFPTEHYLNIDLSQWLFEGFILKEKEFREYLKQHNWNQYFDCNVTIAIPNDCVIPAWASIMVTSNLAPFVKNVVVGSYNELLTSIYQQKLAQVDYSLYFNKAVILKGCSKKPVPESAYVFAVQQLQKVAKSIMYGEACSAVPLFKKAK